MDKHSLAQKTSHHSAQQSPDQHKQQSVYLHPAAPTQDSTDTASSPQQLEEPDTQPHQAHLPVPAPSNSHPSAYFDQQGSFLHYLYSTHLQQTQHSSNLQHPD